MKFIVLQPVLRTRLHHGIMSSLEAISLYTLGVSPNPWKVALILEELGIPYKFERIKMSDIRKEPYISVNPNGRVPAIKDPNKGITLWEVSYYHFASEYYH
jgi:Glutathione S-transferase, N-terminal domain